MQNINWLVNGDILDPILEPRCRPEMHCGAPRVCVPRAPRVCAPRVCRGFTLIEVMVAVSIFTVVMAIMAGIIFGLFKTMRQGEEILNKEQRLRMCFSRLSRDLASLAIVSPPQFSFWGEQNSFFLSACRRIAWWNIATAMMPPLAPLRATLTR